MSDDFMIPKFDVTCTCICLGMKDGGVFEV